ncbi:hypothetical protein WOLCODRAFT_119235 [Wolfiporia cocos MD-104 SS10]|uniref:Nucleoside triphosphate hydrolase protein n=1 Tax=Wolfiporia cocos (strain MD-104) TaxID=742152 RepID=A0A2H3JJ58_WOLCO|nr:hypothetical protein WOLCODRAFT_119235 [Wolfiporia cocos MD-104 SS10]
MPRIRKKTSKRGTTNQREKIKHKVAETRKKRKKEAKKNPQWKTKHPKDPGIPNNFPYKDQILAEVAEERRKAAEEKQKRKEEKKAAIASEGAEAAAGSEEAFDGVRTVNAKLQSKGSSKLVPAAPEPTESDDDVPVLMNRDLPNLKAVLDSADVVIEVLDARDPLRCRSSHIEELSEGKKVLLVLNKIDACPRESVSSWATTLRISHPTILFRSASAFLPDPISPAPAAKGRDKGKARADDAWGTDAALACLRHWASEKGGATPLSVAVIGTTNAGKSAFVNSLLRKAAVPTYTILAPAHDGPTTTAYPQEVALDVEGVSIRLIDTPGLAWVPPEEQDLKDAERMRARDILLRSRGHIERLKGPLPVAAEIVNHAEKEDLMLFYNLPAFADDDGTAFLTALARANGMIKKGGVLDLASTARHILRDWGTGKLSRYTMPPFPNPTAIATTTPAPAGAYAKDEEILARLPTRREMRRGKGAVRLRPGEVENRRVVLEIAYAGGDGSESDVEDEGEENGELEEDEDEEMLDEEDKESGEENEAMDVDKEDEEEEKEEPVILSGKRKRAATNASAPQARPAKKVAFAPLQKESKQTRSAAGARAARKPDLKSKAKIAAKGDALSKKASTMKPSEAAKKPALKKSPVSAPGKKVANSSSKKPISSKGNDGEEAYDFKKFF